MSWSCFRCNHYRGKSEDRLGCAIALLEEVGECETIELIWVDAGFSGEKFANVVDTICGAKVEVVKRNSCDFEILPRRWVVERTFGWLGHYRRLSKDYELLPEVSEAIVYAAMTKLM